MNKKTELLQFFKKSPSGEYIIVVPKKFKDTILNEFQNKVSIDNYGDDIIVKTKSRAILKDIIRIVYKCNK